MTTQADRPAESTVATERPHNRFDDSLQIAFFLSPEDLMRVADEFREAIISHRDGIQVPPKQLTPNTKGLPPEEKQAIRDEVDAANAARVERVRTFLGHYVSPETAAMLSTHMRPTLEGLVLVHCPQDKYGTLVPEHSPLIPEHSVDASKRS